MKRRGERDLRAEVAAEFASFDAPTVIPPNNRRRRSPKPPNGFVFDPRGYLVAVDRVPTRPILLRPILQPVPVPPPETCWAALYLRKIAERRLRCIELASRGDYPDRLLFRLTEVTMESVNSATVRVTNIRSTRRWVVPTSQARLTRGYIGKVGSYDVLKLPASRATLRAFTQPDFTALLCVDPGRGDFAPLEALLPIADVLDSNRLRAAGLPAVFRAPRNQLEPCVLLKFRFEDALDRMGLTHERIIETIDATLPPETTIPLSARSRELFRWLDAKLAPGRGGGQSRRVSIDALRARLLFDHSHAKAPR